MQRGTPSQTDMEIRSIVELWIKGLSPVGKEIVGQFVGAHEWWELCSWISDEVIDSKESTDTELTTCLFHPDVAAVDWHRMDDVNAGYCKDCLREFTRDHVRR